MPTAQAPMPATRTRDLTSLVLNCASSCRGERVQAVGGNVSGRTAGTPRCGAPALPACAPRPQRACATAQAHLEHKLCERVLGGCDQRGPIEDGSPAGDAERDLFKRWHCPCDIVVEVDGG